MPTFKNEGNKGYVISGTHLITGTINFSPGDTVETTEILDSLDGVTRLADTPYYNSVLARQDLTLVGAATTEQALSNPLKTSKIIIRDASVDLEIFINGADNTPGYPIKVDEILEIAVDKNIDKLFISHGAGGTVTILEA